MKGTSLCILLLEIACNLCIGMIQGRVYGFIEIHEDRQPVVINLCLVLCSLLNIFTLFQSQHYQNNRVSPWRFWLEIAACRERLVGCWDVGVSRDENCREERSLVGVEGFMSLKLRLKPKPRQF